MDAGASIKLGGAVANLVASSWLRARAPELGRNATIGELLKARFPDVLQRRLMARQFEKLADEVVRSLRPVLDVEFGGLRKNERNAATLLVSSTLSDVAASGSQVLFSTELDAELLARHCETENYKRRLHELDSAGQHFAEFLLREAATRAVQVFVNLPNFGTDAAREILRREKALADLLEETLARIPVSLPGTTPDVFTANYRAALIRHLDRLQLYGVSVDQRMRSYGISVSYLSLAVTTSTADTGSDGVGKELRAEDTLQSSSRVVIRGEAGSGKTTLLQWTAVQVARGNMPSVARDVVPIFVRLRHYATSERLPTPEDLLSSSVPNIQGEMPSGWVHQLLRSGNALILIDGVDEVPEADRSKVDSWLIRLLDDFPLCHFVVTSRPPAMPDDWMSPQGFQMFDLLPMTPPDIDKFIDKWHDAVDGIHRRKLTTEDPAGTFEQKLKAAVRGSRSLFSLASNPLLCALLCALNRDRRAKLPGDRMELYRIALEMLLERRDKERYLPEKQDLSRRTKELILQHIAFWMLLNGASDIDFDSAIAIIERRLPSLRNVRMSAADVLRHLLVRSGLLREPEEGKIDFIHRTFQEYLAAKQAVEDHNIALLASRGHEDQWREVIILAAGHATMRDRGELLKRLIERGRKDARLRHRLHLLAVACLETSPELETEISETVSSVLQALIPPRTFKEAHDLASAGDLVLPQLANAVKARQNAAADSACIRTLALVGGDQAMNALKRYSTEERGRVVKELVNCWRYFDAKQYAIDVLANIPVGIQEFDFSPVLWSTEVEKCLRINELEIVTGLPFLNTLHALVVDAIVTEDALASLVKCRRLTHLALGTVEMHPNTLVRGLKRLNNLTSLELDFADNVNIAHFAGLQHVPNLSIRLFDQASVSIQDLHRLPNLRRLSISDGHIERWVIDRGVYSLNELSLAYCSSDQEIDLTDVTPNLRGLNINGNGMSGKLAGLQTMSQLRYLMLSDIDDLESLEPWTPLPSLEWLFIGQLPELVSLKGLEHSHSIRTIAIDRCDNLADYSQLAKMQELRSVYIYGCQLVDVNFTRGCVQLSELTLNDCLCPEQEVVQQLRLSGFSVSMRGVIIHALRPSTKNS